MMRDGHNDEEKAHSSLRLNITQIHQFSLYLGSKETASSILKCPVFTANYISAYALQEVMQENPIWKSSLITQIGMNTTTTTDNKVTAFASILAFLLGCKKNVVEVIYNEPEDTPTSKLYASGVQYLQLQLQDHHHFGVGTHHPRLSMVFSPHNIKSRTWDHLDTVVSQSNRRRVFYVGLNTGELDRFKTLDFNITFFHMHKATTSGAVPPLFLCEQDAGRMQLCKDYVASGHLSEKMSLTIRPLGGVAATIIYTVNKKCVAVCCSEEQANGSGGAASVEKYCVKYGYDMISLENDVTTTTSAGVSSGGQSESEEEEKEEEEKKEEEEEKEEDATNASPLPPSPYRNIIHALSLEEEEAGRRFLYDYVMWVDTRKGPMTPEACDIETACNMLEESLDVIMGPPRSGCSEPIVVICINTKWTRDFFSLWAEAEEKEERDCILNNDIGMCFSGKHIMELDVNLKNILLMNNDES